MKEKSQLQIALFLLIGLPILGIVLIVRFISNRPYWEISLRNSDNGVIVEVYQSDDDRPTSSERLPGISVARDVERMRRVNLSPEIGQTTFYDETLRPGRWTLIIDHFEIDLMERGMDVKEVTIETPAR